MQYDGPWFDVGRKRDYLNVNKSFLDGDFELEIAYEKYPWGYLGTNVAVDFSKVNIIPPVIIGNDCIIAPGTTLGPYAIIGDGWTIERKACIRNSVLWKRYSFFPDKGEEICRRFLDAGKISQPRIEGKDHNIADGHWLEADQAEE